MRNRLSKKTTIIVAQLMFFPLLFGSYKAVEEYNINPKANDPGYVKKVISHYKKQLTYGLDTYGPEDTPFWMASLDTYTGKYPDDATRPPHIPQRAYLDRFVDAPRGANLYWDMPSIVATYTLSELTGQDWYIEKAEAYLKAFLSRCVASNGIFLWGNHYYYDAFRDSTMKFGSQPIAVDMKSEAGDLHEIRPILPAWETFWRVSPQATEREIRASTKAHLVDARTGEFNRHADGKSQHAFLEAGASLIYSLGWLYSKTSESDLLHTADKIANYSFAQSHPSTGLMANDPTSNRWDNYTTTTEIGLWTGCLLKAAQMADEPYKQNWITMADKALSSWLQYGYDTKQQQYYGMLHIDNGEPIFREAGDDYPYKPSDYSNVWEPLFPTHNYPMTMAESCLMLYGITKKNVYKEACSRWVKIIEKELPARGGKGAYAEHYGRVINYLLNCNEKFKEEYYRELATKVADEAVTSLFANNMFRSHPGEYRYDAVDGVGILALSLIWLETGKKPDMMGLYY
jgi:hypothetical protein